MSDSRRNRHTRRSARPLRLEPFESRRLLAVEVFGSELADVIRVLITCGAWTPEGDFLELAEFDMQRLLMAWQEAVFELYLAEEKIDPEVVENMRSWQHSGFSVDQSVFLPAGDQAGIERLIQ